MSVVARRSLVHPQWLAIAITLAVAWLLYRPADDASVPAVERSRQVSDSPPDCNGRCITECHEGSCDGTYAISEADVHLSPIQGLDSDSDQASIYGNTALAADPFLAAEARPASPVIVPVQYVEPLDSTCATASTYPDNVANCVCPLPLPPTDNCSSCRQSADRADQPPVLAPSIPPQMCSLTDRRSGVPVATVRIATEIRSETLDLATYHHPPGKCDVVSESDDSSRDNETGWDDGQIASAEALAELATYEAPTVIVDSAVEPVNQSIAANNSTLEVQQTIEQSQSWMQAGHIDEAVDLLTNALFSHPQDVHLLQHIAIAYLTKQDTESALSAAEQCLEIDRENADSNEVMSHVLQALGQMNRARHYAEHALFLRRNSDAAGLQRP